MNNGSTPELYKKMVHPRGWPHPVEVRELTAGDMLDMYDKGKTESDQVQYEILIASTFNPETGRAMFTSLGDIRALPARMLPGLLELLKMSTELNALVVKAEGDRPISRPEENSSST